MAKIEYHCQCMLRREISSDSYYQMISWIPERYAERGRHLDLKRESKWESGWYVSEVYNKERTDKVIPQCRDYLHQREVSDV